MGLNDTPRAVRLHIAFLGRTNVGKSSLINAITGQNAAIVSEEKGTTTDPVYKSMEILPLGPCVLIDTAGLDDYSPLGKLRTAKTLEVLGKTDIAVFVTDSTALEQTDIELLNLFKQKNIPLIIALNKSDLISSENADISALKAYGEVIPVCAIKGRQDSINALLQAISSLIPKNERHLHILSDILTPGDTVILVTPIDSSAPKGRLILPQQQVIRDVLDSGAIALITQPEQLSQTLQTLSVKPRIVVTDSQVFGAVAAQIPRDIMLTSFSILMARLKGELTELIRGAAAISKLRDGDRVLIAEGCTHHVQDEDIGKVKIPKWILTSTGKRLEFEFTAGNSFSDNVSSYSLIVHCGACMLNPAEMKRRATLARQECVPMVNYGVLIAYIQGILERAIQPFEETKDAWEELKCST